MPNIKISLDNLADAIKNLKNRDRESLLIMLTGKGNELLKRKEEIKKRKVKTLKRNEVFGV